MLPNVHRALPAFSNVRPLIVTLLLISIPLSATVAPLPLSVPPLQVKTPVVVMLASWLPALVAIGMDPALALREE